MNIARGEMTEVKNIETYYYVYDDKNRTPTMPYVNYVLKSTQQRPALSAS